jgi:hypothetical protein
MLSSFINCQAGAQTAPAKEPVFIYLDAFITDQVNLDLTEDRLRRLLQRRMLARWSFSRALRATL